MNQISDNNSIISIFKKTVKEKNNSDLRLTTAETTAFILVTRIAVDLFWSTYFFKKFREMSWCHNVWQP